MARSFSATWRERARSTRRCSAPKISGVSARTAAAPMRASRSEQTPRAGLAVMPLKESEPPQLRPSTSFEAGTGVRRMAASRSMWRSTARTPASTEAGVPPVS